MNGTIGTHAQHCAHILMIPHPAVPHVIPFVHLAGMLVRQGGIQCTVLSFDDLLEKIDREKLPEGLHLLGLPMDLRGFTTKPIPKQLTVVTHSEELHSTTKNYFDKLLEDKALGKEVPTYTCVISDFSLDWTIELASKLGASRYLLAAFSAFFTLTSASLDLLRANGAKADSNAGKSWVEDPLMPRANRPWPPAATVMIFEMFFRSLSHVEGIFINTFYEFESLAIDYLRDMGKHIIPVGPVESQVQVSKVAPANFDYVDDDCLRWLGKQSAKSIVYLNFGTTGFNNFTLEMVHELALGLEASQAKFLWVLRPPPGLKSEELDQVLPSGFEERVKDRALISRGWAPQLAILEHPSTAAFFMHCGWNSVLEAAARGVPIIGWPTYADQPFNGQYVTEVTKVGILLPHREKKVDRYDVEAAIRTMMYTENGRDIMRRAEEIKIAAANAKKPEGSSYKAVSGFVEAIRRFL